MDFVQVTDVPLPRGGNVDWSLYHEESPKNNPLFSHALMMELFNHTATFRLQLAFSLWNLLYSEIPLAPSLKRSRSIVVFYYQSCGFGSRPRIMTAEFGKNLVEFICANKANFFF
jgi:hypothetical protein